MQPQSPRRVQLLVHGVPDQGMGEVVAVRDGAGDDERRGEDLVKGRERGVDDHPGRRPDRLEQERPLDGRGDVEQRVRRSDEPPAPPGDHVARPRPGTAASGEVGCRSPSRSGTQGADPRAGAARSPGRRTDCRRSRSATASTSSSESGASATRPAAGRRSPRPSSPPAAATEHSASLRSAPSASVERVVRVGHVLRGRRRPPATGWAAVLRATCRSIATVPSSAQCRSSRSSTTGVGSDSATRNRTTPSSRPRRSSSGCRRCSLALARRPSPA